jgi:serine/threonine-protein kinase HipA
MSAPQAAMETVPEDLAPVVAGPGPSSRALWAHSSMARVLKGVSLRYAPQWLETGLALSEDLPLIDQEFLPHDKETAAGAVDDARPDRWGERVIRVLERPPRLSVLDFLLYCGDDERFGALGVSLSATQYQPRGPGPLPQLADAQAIATLVAAHSGWRTGARNPAPPDCAGRDAGRRPAQGLVTLDGRQWVLKFAEPGDVVDTPLVEHAAMTLAAQAGMQVAPTRPVPLHKGHAVAVQRFDRAGTRRLHALSAHVALKAAGEKPGYPELAQLLRRKGVAEDGLYAAQMRELFRRMVFNILIDNTDDHEKNHALLMADEATGALALSPAFDVLPSGQALGYQQMRVGQEGADATLANALSECRQFGLSRPQALAEVQRVCAVVDNWQAHFLAAGVSPADVDSLAQQIDRPYLLELRRSMR